MTNIRREPSCLSMVRVQNARLPGTGRRATSFPKSRKTTGRRAECGCVRRHCYLTTIAPWSAAPTCPLARRRSGPARYNRILTEIGHHSGTEHQLVATLFAPRSRQFLDRYLSGSTDNLAFRPWPNMRPSGLRGRAIIRCDKRFVTAGLSWHPHWPSRVPKIRANS